jgi:hypothetical protein
MGAMAAKSCRMPRPPGFSSPGAAGSQTFTRLTPGLLYAMQRAELRSRNAASMMV